MIYVTVCEYNCINIFTLYPLPIQVIYQLPRRGLEIIPTPRIDKDYIATRIN